MSKKLISATHGEADKAYVCSHLVGDGPGKTNFEALIRADEENTQPDTTELFSWLSTSLLEYPDTLNLKMWAVIQEPGMHAHFRIERTDHPLAKEYHEGITPHRVREIMFRRLPQQPA